MKTLFFSNNSEIFAVETEGAPNGRDVEKLDWLFQADYIDSPKLEGSFIGPRKEIVSPWSTNATEITQNVGIAGIKRIERFVRVPEGEVAAYDPMLQALYEGLSQESLVISEEPEALRFVDDIAAYNQEAGLALSDEEISYLEEVSKKLGRDFSDSEVYAFSQINSEHCRHKIFNGSFVIDGEEQEKSLFRLIKDTSKTAPDNLVSAYKDNVAFINGPSLMQFAPQDARSSGFFGVNPIDSVISIKAETHNFPTTVEPFNGASTGSGGEIRDRMAGGTGSLPMAGSAVYMTAYPRLQGSCSCNWEKQTKERNWKYQSPLQILIKASNGASDFGNKFGQPLINGSLLTYEGRTPLGFYGFDRTVMLAGGVGYAKREHALKLEVSEGDILVLLGGDNYRIGMAGGSVSSVDTGAYSQALELSAVQRANPEMQKRVYNVIRALVESAKNPIKMIHDHGAGGHINCFSELLDPKGGTINVDKLPLGDPTLSMKEILCNESQERMGLIVSAADLPLLEDICERERAPMYAVGEIVGDERIVFSSSTSENPMDLPLEVLFGSSPKTIIRDERPPLDSDPLEYSIQDGAALRLALENVLSLEGVACKDWLTNKVDRSVTGQVALQQCTGPLQLPLNNAGVMALDYTGRSGVATALGHAPVPALLDEAAGSVLSVTESLTNIVFVPLKNGLDSIVLSANWMWPAKHSGEGSRLYSAVKAVSEFCQDLGIAVPTGKDSLSMTMKYKDGKVVHAPGTVVITAVGECSDVCACVTPDLKPIENSVVLHVDLSGLDEQPLGGSSFAQSLGQLGKKAPSVSDAALFKSGFTAIQELVKAGELLAGHDVSSGGLLAAISEMAFAGDAGVELRFEGSEQSVVSRLFCEKPGVVLQVEKEKVSEIQNTFSACGLDARLLGDVRGTQIRVQAGALSFSAPVAELRRTWFKPSFLLDSHQSTPALAKERYETLDIHPLSFRFPKGFSGKAKDYGIDPSRMDASGITAAIIRNKGTNGEREMALSMFAAGFDVKDVTMSDLMSGRESLEKVNFIVFPGGFSDSDVLGAARGWAGAFKYNERAMEVLRNYYARPDTLSLGVCNGCQLMMALDLIDPERSKKVEMQRNESCKFESSFLGVRVQETNSVMLKGLAGSQLGIWVAHGEGKFSFPEQEDSYDIALKYLSADYPANPNGSENNAAGISSKDGRHLAMMPHLERAFFSWQWGYQAKSEVGDFEISPWALAFIAARDWIRERV